MDAYTKLEESVKLLSLPFSEQKKRFPEFVDIPFEILDSFENQFMVLPDLVESGCLSHQGIANLIRLHNLIGFTSSNQVLKDLDEQQFEFAPEWQKVRKLAGETMIAFVHG